MTDLNKSNNDGIDTDKTNNAAEESFNEVDNQMNSQQVSIKAWSQKLLVVVLCIASFYGGWKSYESNMVSKCTANGGKMIEGQRTMLCQSS